MSRNHFGYFKVEKYNDDEEARNRHLIYAHSVITNRLIVEPIFEYIVVPVSSSCSISSSNVEYVHEQKKQKTEDGEKDDNANKVKSVSVPSSYSISHTYSNSEHVHEQRKRKRDDGRKNNNAKKAKTWKRAGRIKDDDGVVSHSQSHIKKFEMKQRRKVEEKERQIRYHLSSYKQLL